MFSLKIPCTGVVTSGFGFRTKPKVGWHSGLDMANALGTVIKSAYKGVCVFAGWRGNYGKCVIIKHPTIGNVWTLYGHLSEIKIGGGDKVEQGAKIGLMGSTGYSTGSHLHFEVRVGFNGIAAARNPVNYLS